jgi:thiamine biosynthesis lipoprotein
MSHAELELPSAPGPSRVDLAFPSMGGEARVRLESSRLSQDRLERLADGVHSRIEAVEATLSRFRPGSELSALNRDPRSAVPASPLLRRAVLAALWAAGRSGGLVDATLLGELERAGYRESWDPARRADLGAALAAAPPRRPAAPARRRIDERIGLDAHERIVRAPGVRLDPGGIAKGMAADIAAAALPAGVRYAISCCGDVAVGGEEPWELAVLSARDDHEVHRLRVRAGGVATSGIGARVWRRDDGTYAHHVLDPATGRPAWTGLVAATAVAGSALEAEVLAKAALLSGPLGARRLLRRRGGVLQHDDGRVEIVPAPAVVRLPAPVAA